MTAENNVSSMLIGYGRTVLCRWRACVECFSKREVLATFYMSKAGMSVLKIDMHTLGTLGVHE